MTKITHPKRIRSDGRLEAKVHGRVLSAIRVMNACSGECVMVFLPAHLHFLRRLTDGQRR